MSLYDDLGVDRDADKAAIKKAYRRAAQRSHPDKKGGSDDEFCAVQLAYEVLSDDGRRRRYDETGEAKEPDKNRQAVDALKGVLLQLVDQADLNRVDLVDVARQVVAKKIESYRAEIAGLLARAEKREKALKRVRHKKPKGLDVLSAVLEADLEFARRSVAATEEAVEVGNLMLEMLEDYEYVVDPPQEAEPPHFGFVIG